MIETKPAKEFRMKLFIIISKSGTFTAEDAAAAVTASQFESGLSRKGVVESEGTVEASNEKEDTPFWEEGGADDTTLID